MSAALAAAKRGLQVKIFAKNQVVGSPVRCGEFFAAREMMKELTPNVEDVYELFEMPVEAIQTPTNTIRVISPRGKSWEFDFKSYTIDRHIFESYLAKKAMKLGAEIQLKTPTQLFIDDGKYLVGASRETAEEAKIVIAADGFPSNIARKAGLPVDKYINPNTVATNVQYLMTNLDIEPEVTELYFDTKSAPGGYAWIIPTSTHSGNVGTGVRTNYMDRSLSVRDYLDYFVNTHSTAAPKLKGWKSVSYVADILPVDGPLEKTWTDRVLAVGDAACMVMPTNGGGIQTAMITGKIAAEAAADHLQRGVPLSAYEDRWKKQIGTEMRISTILRRVADHFMKSNNSFSTLMRIIGNEGVRDTIMCRVPARMKPFFRFVKNV